MNWWLEFFVFAQKYHISSYIIYKISELQSSPGQRGKWNAPTLQVSCKDVHIFCQHLWDTLERRWKRFHSTSAKKGNVNSVLKVVWRTSWSLISWTNRLVSYSAKKDYQDPRCVVLSLNNIQYMIGTRNKWQRYIKHVRPAKTNGTWRSPLWKGTIESIDIFRRCKLWTDLLTRSIAGPRHF